MSDERERRAARRPGVVEWLNGRSGFLESVVIFVCTFAIGVIVICAITAALMVGWAVFG